MNPYNTADAQRPPAPEQVEFKPVDPEAVEQVRAAIKRHRERQNRRDKEREGMA